MQYVEFVCKELQGESEIYDLDSLDADSKIMCIQNMLYYCIPELDLNLTKDKIICTECVTALEAAYKLKTQCLQAQESIRACLNERKLSLNEAFLKELIIFVNYQTALHTNESQTEDNFNESNFVSKELKVESFGLVRINVQGAIEDQDLVDHNETDSCNSTNAECVESVRNCHTRNNCNNLQGECEHEKVVYNCPVCTYNTENKIDMQNHIKETHRGISVSKRRKAEERQSSQFGHNLGSRGTLQDDPLPNNSNNLDELVNTCDTLLINDRNVDSTALLNSSNPSKDYENEADMDDERYDYCLDDIHNEQDQEEHKSLADSDITRQQNDKDAETTEGDQSLKHNTTILTCDKCSFNTYVKEDFENHLLNHNKRSCIKNINYNDNEKSKILYNPVSKVDSQIYKMKFKHKKKYFKCRRCNYKSTKESYLNIHKKEAHSKNTRKDQTIHKPQKSSHERVTKKIQNKCYKCTTCNFASVAKDELNIHITTHLKQGYYK
ncbi:hypothetical protein ILUMI_08988 [Ignelater luminosus]|uniref:C2H2-type domain-containing protein n=1 Tax=Ignelater luminosus TaxID=2038154 RepID=A0A8K0D3B9_IGNLU|nr:hypothetical protein ILUMI_08988 [Ignelater luminosus]